MLYSLLLAQKATKFSVPSHSAGPTQLQTTARRMSPMPRRLRWRYFRGPCRFASLFFFSLFSDCTSIVSREKKKRRFQICVQFRPSMIIGAILQPPWSKSEAPRIRASASSSAEARLRDARPVHAPRIGYHRGHARSPRMRPERGVRASTQLVLTHHRLLLHHLLLA